MFAASILLLSVSRQARPSQDLLAHVAQAVEILEAMGESIVASNSAKIIKDSLADMQQRSRESLLRSVSAGDTADPRNQNHHHNPPPLVPAGLGMELSALESLQSGSFFSGLVMPPAQSFDEFDMAFPSGTVEAFNAAFSDDFASLFGGFG